MKRFSNIAYFSLIIVSTIILYNGCESKFPKEKIFVSSYSLLDQDSSRVIFPDDFKGKVVAISFSFTNCPDICPITVNKMTLIQKRIKDEKVNNVEFIVLTFDPERDTPSILKQYAKIRDIDESNFHFLTGNKKSIEAILRKAAVVAVAEDTTYTDDGEPIYFFTHTDRISLLDEEGRIRKDYPGSKSNIDEIVKDIKSLAD